MDKRNLVEVYNEVSISIVLLAIILGAFRCLLLVMRITLHVMFKYFKAQSSWFNNFIFTTIEVYWPTD